MKIATWLYVGLVLGMVLIGACNGCGGITPTPDPDPIPPIIISGCPEVCDTWRMLGCSEGDPTPAGASCETVCENAREIPAFTSRFDCIVSANTCDEARKCEE